MLRSRASAMIGSMSQGIPARWTGIKARVRGLSMGSIVVAETF